MIAVIFNYFKTSPVYINSSLLGVRMSLLNATQPRVLRRYNCDLYQDGSRAAVSSRKVSRCSAGRNSIVTKIITAVYHGEETQGRRGKERKRTRDRGIEKRERARHGKATEI